MQMREFRNARNRAIGRVYVGPTGVEQGHDYRGRRVGQYDPRTNETRDARGKRVGWGNLLPTLITKAL